ncbi:ABC transporter permease [uncultured Aeromicrobium sp.]|uniref:ABC transporter permease n=1 Tax=uncultured Aeromicrobium sp. TaxID=337820 RepID=UPI0025D62ED7|nr:ABC transporter permease subunit [uncultured Aeromicrobium sp.]
MTSRSRAARLGWWLPVVAVALYVTIPVGASIAYAFFPSGRPSLEVFSRLAEDPDLGPAVMRTLLITALTIVTLLAVLVPAVVAVHLWAPGLRPALEVLCTLPLVVPPIAVAAGVVALLRWGAQQGRGSVPSQISQFLQNPELPLILVGTYVVLCLPFTFRSIDAGLRTIELKALVEGSASLGSSTLGTIWRVVIPCIRGPVLFAVFFATAVCFGEFAVAATLNRETIPVWLFTVSSTDFRASIAVSVILHLTTWTLLLIASFTAGRHGLTDRRSAAAAVDLDPPVSAAVAPIPLTAISAAEEGSSVR